MSVVPATEPTSSPVRPSTPDQLPNEAEGSLSRGTLGRQLVIRVTALVAVVAILLSAAAALTARQLLVGQIDRQLDNVTGRFSGGGPGSPNLLKPFGQPIGTFITLRTADGSVISSAILQDKGRISSLSDDAAAALDGVRTKHKTTVDVADLGRYRVAVYGADYIPAGSDTTQDAVLIVGIPLAEVDNNLIQLMGTEAILSLLAIGAAALGGASVDLAGAPTPHRVAATAQQVSQLELGRGEVALAVRVDERDADPRNEVGRVGQAFNHMLTNVDGALAARQASESKLRQFIADASHELRNPLAAIRGYAELTRRSRAEITPDAAFAMSRVESEADRMSRLVEDMLLLARLDSGPNLDLGPTDLSETIVNATSDARVAGPDHRWSLDIPDHPIVVTADRHRVHQVVANLLANARTHTPAGTSVRAGLRTVGDRAVISVTDDGPGVPPDIQGRVFERFTRADTSRARASGGGGTGSTGLGLAIVAAVVDAHRGDVWVESRPGHTEFCIALPMSDSGRTPTTMVV